MQKETPINLNATAKKWLVFLHGEFHLEKGAYTQKQTNSNESSSTPLSYASKPSSQTAAVVAEYNKYITEFQMYTFALAFLSLPFQCKQIDDKHFKETGQNGRAYEMV